LNAASASNATGSDLDSARSRVGKMVFLDHGERRHAMAKNYESEITRFLKDLKVKSPEIERRQREGRAIYWDKQLDPDELRRWKESNVPQ
jgi:Protein of unknown function (DUF3460)